MSTLTPTFQLPPLPQALPKRYPDIRACATAKTPADYLAALHPSVEFVSYCDTETNYTVGIGEIGQGIHYWDLSYLHSHLKDVSAIEYLGVFSLVPDSLLSSFHPSHKILAYLDKQSGVAFYGQETDSQSFGVFAKWSTPYTTIASLLQAVSDATLHAGELPDHLLQTSGAKRFTLPTVKPGQFVSQINPKEFSPHLHHCLSVDFHKKVDSTMASLYATQYEWELFKKLVSPSYLPKARPNLGIRYSAI